MYFGLVVLMDHGKIKKYWEDGDLYYDDSGCLPYYHRDLVVNVSASRKSPLRDRLK